VKLILAALVLALVSQITHAELFDARTLREYLDESEAQTSFMRRTLSMGYVSGVFDAIEGQRACPQEQVAASELMSIVRRYLAAQADLSGKPAAPLVVAALAQRFPCNR
jgi:uncharacterized protein with NAD-binding domain and iron-sulfur cluster